MLVVLSNFLGWWLFEPVALQHLHKHRETQVSVALSRSTYPAVLEPLGSLPPCLLIVCIRHPRAQLLHASCSLLLHALSHARAASAPPRDASCARSYAS